MNKSTPVIKVSELTLAYGSFTLMKDISFEVYKKDIFIIMGGSGCGKSTLIRSIMGLKSPKHGSIYMSEVDFWGGSEKTRNELMQKTGVLFQSGALWSSMTLAENISVPLQQYTKLSASDISDLVSLKLSLTGLSGFEDYYPSEISGGMCKRAGLARALALDPEILFLDEPSAGLDPISAHLLDDLILELRDSLSTTFIVVTHDLDSIFAIGDNAIFLDATSHTITARGKPKDILNNPDTNKTVLNFLTRGQYKGNKR